MTVRNRVVRGEAASDHIVQFFDSDESRIESVAAFLADGYRRNEPLIVVARPSIWTSIVEHLQAMHVPVQRLIANDMLVVKDANDTLRRLSRNGVPDAAAFESAVASPVIEMARRGRVRAYGEMVDILAQRTDLPDAIALERLWNDLLQRTRVFLMCGYSAAHFVGTNTHAALRLICRAHAHVHSSTSDPLAAWLLASAHPGSAESATLN
jgi:hypothetical protein